MKNVAKCDTWCELQNPVNHRVFERKLRPKPLGRGHVCLGVTRRCPPDPVGGRTGRMMAFPCALSRGWHKYRVLGDRRRGDRWLSNLGALSRACVDRGTSLAVSASVTRRFQRDPRSGGVTR